MQHYPEDHHKKPKKHLPDTEEIGVEPKSEIQSLQKRLNVDLEQLKEQIDAFEMNTAPTHLDGTIIQEHIAKIKNTIALDESLPVHLHDQIQLLRTYENIFNKHYPAK